MGEGFTWETQDRARDVAAAQAAWAKAPRADGGSRDQACWCSTNSTSRCATTTCRSTRWWRRCSARRPDLHVVVTGRNAKPELIEAADLVTEMTLVKHHFAAGVKAQQGIEF